MEKKKMKNLKANLFVTPICIVIGAIVTIVLALLKQGWSYYLVMLAAGLLVHGLFIKSTVKIANGIEADPEGKFFNPKKESTKGYIIRSLIFIVVYAALVYKADIKNTDNGLWNCLYGALGYLTYRLVFIICILIFKTKEVDA
jgi:hypothetical protein